jgi:hypothetical protein
MKNGSDVRFSDFAARASKLALELKYITRTQAYLLRHNHLLSQFSSYTQHSVPRQVDICIAVLQLAIVLKEHLMDYLLLLVKTACYVLTTYNCVRSKLLAQTGMLAYKPARSRARVSKREQTL